MLCPPAAPFTQSEGRALPVAMVRVSGTYLRRWRTRHRRWRDYDRRQRKVDRPAAFPQHRRGNITVFLPCAPQQPLPLFVSSARQPQHQLAVFSHCNGRVGGFCYRFGVSNNLLRHRRTLSAISCGCSSTGAQSLPGCVVSTSTTSGACGSATVCGSTATFSTARTDVVVRALRSQR